MPERQDAEAIFCLQAQAFGNNCASKRLRRTAMDVLTTSSHLTNMLEHLLYAGPWKWRPAGSVTPTLMEPNIGCRRQTANGKPSK